MSVDPSSNDLVPEVAQYADRYDGNTQVVEGAVVGGMAPPVHQGPEGTPYVEPVDAGFADVEKEAVPVPAAVDLSTILFHPHVAPNAKVLLMQMARLGSTVTAEMLSKGSGLTAMQVLYGLRPFIAAGVVEESSRPNYDTKKFERTFRLVSIDKLALITEEN